ncbi:hypothetical protein ISN45_At03g030100 [Arabidopsis thaliana x Arabidopsis arenosa]|uniref:Uncharacterized protein n=2 Tax=Arabidopsis TaxID=3701 RepID=A0A8T2F9G1_ARASU|nr:hypothetical protein ISN45_At03g030100 [Arabidopsis thaliana x Arabidopsis arenosa]KAG7632878.1 hypothetical protein ISN44_As03g029670 [Arabidopsis suecica]
MTSRSDAANAEEQTGDVAKPVKVSVQANGIAPFNTAQWDSVLENVGAPQINMSNYLH